VALFGAYGGSLMKNAMTIRCLAPCLALLCLLSVPTAAQTVDTGNDTAWEISVRQKTLFNSHTSYEFGNPLDPIYSPLSRLEFSLDSAWAGTHTLRDDLTFTVPFSWQTGV
jgi:hypothetical protein